MSTTTSTQAAPAAPPAPPPPAPPAPSAQPLLAALGQSLVPHLGALSPAPGERSWLRLPAPEPEWGMWLLAWGPGSSTGWHDHGLSAGAFAVLTGELTEYAVTRRRPDSGLVATAAGDSGAACDVPLPPDGPRVRRLGPAELRPFGRDHVHDVRNETAAIAYSLHVYAPDLPLMHRYRLDEERGLLVHTATERGGEDW